VEIVGKTLIRFARNSLSLLLTGAIAYYKNDPRFLVLAPLINAVAKHLREKYGLKHLIF
jgi:hypothetical protein